MVVVYYYLILNIYFFDGLGVEVTLSHRRLVIDL